MQSKNEWGRRGFLIGAGTLAAAPLMGTPSVQAQGPSTNVSSRTVSRVAGRRKLGALEVSSIGLGVQNMSRTYQTTIPTGPRCIDIIRAAFDRGVTFFDAAEAYGPHEVERILGEGCRAVPRQGRHHVQVRLEHRSARPASAARAQQPSRSHQAS